MRQAIVENGIVTNVVVGDAGGIEIPEDSPIGIDWSYNGVNFVAPPAPPFVMPSMTPRQVRLILNAQGLRAGVEAAVAASDQDTKDMWEFSSVFLRDDPVLVAMASGLGMTSDQLDAMFIAGSKL